MGFFDEAKKQRELADEKKRAEAELKKAITDSQEDESLSKNELKEQEIAALKQQAEFARISDADIANIKIATSTICEKFDVLDTVFAIEVHKDSLFGSLFGGGPADPFSVFSGVNKILKKKCYSIGGHAVINCEFNWETGVSSEVLGMSIPGFSRKLHMIYAYGTAVKITT
jgi:hypothetical protein